ncbi:MULTISPECIES: hypothetical protein [unclassified Coleofasciculus]|uniref:hypothetical protein n=1 Tax=unclassified Coleofasciculus TaxID=2692782 RepID=UPI0019F971D7|nr:MULTISPECIES: hypothetical protein [unclassified Coleofasciculus]MBE9129846.1 hypothetical protein [Coleofasciculus sp. LEGE 07081]MBE9152294.1 hypothetical protein [Coleofasciculus sp. LEGE 07092]
MPSDVMKIPELFDPYVELFQILDGKGQLHSPNGQFLGRLSSKADYVNSILNPVGDYGNSFSPISIHNPQGDYGGEFGIYSPFNPNCLNPPLICFLDQPILVLTINPSLCTNGLKRVDPYLMLTIYEALSNTPFTGQSPPALPLARKAALAQLQAKIAQLNVTLFGLSNEE